MQISYHPIITEKCEKKRFLLKFHKCRPAQVSLLPALGREMPQNRWKYPDGSVTIKMYECALSVTCGDRSPLLSLRDIFPRSGGSPSSKGEPLAIHASFISLPKPLPLGEVDLRSKDGEGEDADLVTTLFSRESRSGKHSLVQTQKGPPQCAAVPFALMKNYPYGERKWLVTLPQQAGSF